MVIAGRSAATIEVTGMFDGFRDLYGRFQVQATGPRRRGRPFVTDAGEPTCRCVVHQPGGGTRPIESDVGLEAQVFRRRTAPGCSR